MQNNPQPPKKLPLSQRAQDAVELTKMGFRVIPLIPNGRIPAIRGWIEKATDDPAVAADWWSQADFNIGIVCGRYDTLTGPRWLTVADYDCKHDKPGLTVFKEHTLRQWTSTLKSTTASGGIHCFFWATVQIGNSVGEVADGVDIRCHHGYVIAPGSVIDGKEYHFQNDRWSTPQPMPLQFQEQARTANSSGDFTVASHSPLAPDWLDLPSSIKLAEDWLINSAPEAIQGQRGDETTLKTVHQLVRFGISEPRALVMMFELYNKKCFPRWTFDEMKVKNHNGYLYSDRIKPGTGSPILEFTLAGFEFDKDDEIPAGAEIDGEPKPVDAKEEFAAFLNTGGGSGGDDPPPPEKPERPELSARLKTIIGERPRGTVNAAGRFCLIVWWVADETDWTAECIRDRLDGTACVPRSYQDASGALRLDLVEADLAKRTPQRAQTYPFEAHTQASVAANAVHGRVGAVAGGHKAQFAFDKIYDAYMAAYDAAVAAGDGIVEAIAKAAKAVETVRVGIEQEALKPGKASSTTNVPKQLLYTSAEFVAGFVPPDYLIDGLLQRRFLYSFTSPTGGGKTTIVLLIALHVAFGLPLAGREVERGRVLFFAGENPDDVRMRWILLCTKMGYDPDSVDVVFMPFTLDLSEQQIRDQINAEAAKHGPFSLLIVDTSAAYYSGDDENDNKKLGDHARMLRTFVNLPGGPTVLVTCHPTKTPDMTNLLPRGGGAFLAEVDGNLVVIKGKHDPVAEVTWHGKFRGPDFVPFHFKLIPAQDDKLIDSKGRRTWSVYAEQISDAERETLKQAGLSDQDKVLRAMLDHPGSSLAELAKVLHWVTAGEYPLPNKQKVGRLMPELISTKLVIKGRGDKYELTPKGRKEAEKVAEGGLFD